MLSMRPPARVLQRPCRLTAPVPVRAMPASRMMPVARASSALSLQDAAAVSSSSTRNLFDVASSVDSLQGPDADKLRRIYRITSGVATCTVGPELSTKYNMEQDNRQLVCSVTNVWTLEQAWFNQVRSRKPQTFVAGNRPNDPTGGGGPGKCDFCDWQRYTATDPWGRIEATHAVTASNLFKYGEPYHGVAIIKAHDPLTFTLNQLTDLMAVSDGWFTAAARHYTAIRRSESSVTETPSAEAAAGVAAALPPRPVSAPPGVAAAVAAMPEPWPHKSRRPLHPFFIWNALARAGASQYHGHAQLMATTVPVPTQAQIDQQSEHYAALHPGDDYIRDLLAAHRAVGLLRACAATPAEAAEWREGGDNSTRPVRTHRRRAWVAASLSPIKDMELLVAVEAPHTQDTHDNTQHHPTQSQPTQPHSTQQSTTQQTASNSASPLSQTEAEHGSTKLGHGSHNDKDSHSQNSDSTRRSHGDSCRLTPDAGPTHATGHTEGTGLTDPAFCKALNASLRTLIDDFGVESFNVGILNVPCPSQDSMSQTSSNHDDGSTESATSLMRPLILARVVSRGRMSQPASDFGCLEVIGGASIGHTDPFRVIEAVEKRLGDCLIDEHIPW